MALVEQFEVWSFSENRWQLVATFYDMDVASAVARNRKSNVRLVHATYEDGLLKKKETLAEIGDIRHE